MKRYKEGTLVFHKKRKAFGVMKTGYGRGPIAITARKRGEVAYECYQETEDGAFFSYPSIWYRSNLVVLEHDSPQQRLALTIKYA